MRACSIRRAVYPTATFSQSPLDVSHAAQMPPRMVARGIGRLRPAYLMMWRPWCLAPLSSHARDKGAPSSAGWQRFELALNEYQVETHRVLTSHGESVLVLNYADLLWDATAARRRIERWAPCAGALDPSVNERPPVQRSGGHWKNAASVTTSLATAHPPAASGYDPRRGACIESVVQRRAQRRRGAASRRGDRLSLRAHSHRSREPPPPSPPPTPLAPPTPPTSADAACVAACPAVSSRVVSPELLAAILPFLVAACALAPRCRTYRRCRRRNSPSASLSKDDAPSNHSAAAAAAACRRRRRAGSAASGGQEDEEIAAFGRRLLSSRLRTRQCKQSRRPRRRRRRTAAPRRRRRLGSPTMRRRRSRHQSSSPSSSRLSIYRLDVDLDLFRAFELAAAPAAEDYSYLRRSRGPSCRVT